MKLRFRNFVKRIRLNLLGLMEMWIRRKDVQYKKGKSYLFSTAYHTMIDHIRKHERVTNFDGNEHEGGITYENYS